MTNRDFQRFPIHFDFFYGLLSSLLLLPPHQAYVEVNQESVRVQMGWAFRSQIPRSAIVSVTPSNHHPLSRGVHGWAGRWLVNGSGQGILSLVFQPPQRAYVLGFPVSLKQLLISVADPNALIEFLNFQNTERV